MEFTAVLSEWNDNYTYLDVFVESKCLEEVAQIFKNNRIKYVKVIDDYQQWIDQENSVPEEDETYDGHTLTWHRYHRLADINSFLEYAANTFPSICTIIDIGISVEGNPLRLLKISNGALENKAVWIEGGIHAREWLSPATTTYIINHLIHNWDNEAMSIQNINWHILPIVNPDGYEFSHTHDRLWQKNRSKNTVCFGTDLNHNFGYSWGGEDSSPNPCSEVYEGLSPFSEPETASIENYFLNIESSAQWKAFLTFHSYGQYIVYQADDPSDNEDLLYVGYKMAEALSTQGVHYTVVPSFNESGSSHAWSKRIIGIKYTYTIELRDTGERAFAPSADSIVPSGEDGVAIIRTIADVVDAL
ncbi:hypothetical protein RN001_012979 [Aquatica leii]|uniref:Peptidase M14 domain-containing protein n=1 Tax=Aquatica leii TaxID=1421715 RepID=A0AAN7PPZ8_9COLE|nr:hypothetical protein RN001_012979 [Aquatica leii]